MQKRLEEILVLTKRISLNNAIEVLKEIIQEVRDETLDLISSGRAQVSGLEKKAEGAIRSNPLPAVCIALGVGCVFGLLLRRR